MDPITLLTTALTLAPQIISAGMDIEAFIAKMITAATQDGGPTQADWDALHAAEDQARAALNKDQ